MTFKMITAAFIIAKALGLQASWWWAVICFCGDMILALTLKGDN
jgi:hypothetical protein